MKANTVWYVVDNETGEVINHLLLSLDQQGVPVIPLTTGNKPLCDLLGHNGFTVVYPEVEILKNEVDTLKAKLSEMYTITEELKKTSASSVIFDSALGDSERTVVTPSGVINVTMLEQYL